MLDRCNGSREEFSWQICCKNWFSDRIFYVTITDADIGSLKSLNTLFDKYLDHMLVKFEQNRMVRTIQIFEVFDKKWLFIFDKVYCGRRFCVDAKLFINTKTIIFQCSKKYASPTRVTSLNVAPNMADPISLNEKRP